MQSRYVVRFALGLALLAPAFLAQALSVTAPVASEVIAAGDDYATQILGNAWDMGDALDVDSEESSAVVNQAFSSGIFSGDTTANGANIYPLFMGYGDSLNSSRGAKFPVDTAHYRYVTIKMRATQPSAQTQFARVIFLENGGSYGDQTIVEANYFTLTVNQWMIVTTDMVTNNDGLYHHWLDFPQVTGLRIDPVTTNAAGPYASAHFDIDWIRLTAPATAAQKYLVQWTDSGYSGTYNIAAIDADSASYTLASGVGGTSYAADMTFLTPGQYTIKITRSNNSANASSGAFHINNPPQVGMTSPNMRGDQTQNFAQNIVGNAWGPISATDFSLILNFTASSISYSNPSNTFYGRPATNDPGWFFNLGGHTIDTSRYRSLCFSMEDLGPRSIGIGSVARLFWGNSTSGANLTTSLPIPLDTGPNEYCFADMAAVPLDANPNGGTWSGTKAVLRLDPHEFPVSGTCTSTPSPSNCHDVRLTSLVLSPFAQANPGFTFTWNLADSDNASDNIKLYLDPDLTPGNGNDILIGSASASAGAGQMVWPGSNNIPYGTYHVLAVVNDGLNSVNQYATGPIIVGATDGIFRNGFENIP